MALKWPQIEAQQLSMGDFANVAMTELKFPITAANVRTASEFVNKPWPTANRNRFISASAAGLAPLPGRKPMLQAPLEDLTKAVQELTIAVNLMRDSYLAVSPNRE